MNVSGDESSIKTSITSKKEKVTTEKRSNIQSTWSLILKGIMVKGYDEVEKSLFTVDFSCVRTCPYHEPPAFQLSFNLPLPSTTNVLLPGGMLILQFSNLGEVSMRHMLNGMHNVKETLRMREWFIGVMNQDSCADEGYTSLIRQCTDMRYAYSIEAVSAKCEEEDQVYIVLHMFRHWLDDRSEQDDFTVRLPGCLCACKADK